MLKEIAVDVQTELSPSPDVSHRKPYEKPAIVYEGTLSARAGSGFAGRAADPGLDPGDLFGTGDN